MKKFIISALLVFIPAQAHAQQRLVTLPRLQLPALSNRVVLGGSLLLLGSIVVKIAWNARSQSSLMPKKPRLPQIATATTEGGCLKKAMEALRNNTLHLCQQSAGLDAQIHEEHSRTLDLQKHKRFLEAHIEAQRICKGDPSVQEMHLQHHMATTITRFMDEIGAKSTELQAAKARNETLRNEYHALQATITP